VHDALPVVAWQSGVETVVSGLRCTDQYLVLPFVLPWIGVTGAVPPWITLALGVLALGALARNVRSLWRLHHPRRWSYVQIALMVAAILVIFTVVDIRSLLRL
jgi:cell division protein FtsX